MCLILTAIGAYYVVLQIGLAALDAYEFLTAHRFDDDRPPVSDELILNAFDPAWVGAHVAQFRQLIEAQVR